MSQVSIREECRNASQKRVAFFCFFLCVGNGSAPPRRSSRGVLHRQAIGRWCRNTVWCTGLACRRCREPACCSLHRASFIIITRSFARQIMFRIAHEIKHSINVVVWVVTDSVKVWCTHFVLILSALYSNSFRIVQPWQRHGNGMATAMPWQLRNWADRKLIGPE